MLFDPPEPVDEALAGYFLKLGGGNKPRQRGNAHADRGFGKQTDDSRQIKDRRRSDEVRSNTDE